MRGTRRQFVARVAAALVLPCWLPQRAQAQQLRSIDPLVERITRGAAVRKGRIKLDLPPLVDNGNAVPLTVAVDSPMTAADFVKSIHLVSNRNPVAEMATFHLGPRSGKAAVTTRVRLAGSQTVTAIAALSDGTFWMSSMPVVVTLSACLDES